MPQLKVPARIEQLPAVNDFLHESTPQAFAPIMSSVELVAEELLVNVFSYAYPEGVSGIAEIALAQVDLDGTPMLRFTVKDWGSPFDPFGEAPAPDLTLDAESRPVGGLGIYLIKQVSTHQSYCRLGDANVIDVYFSLPENDR